MFPLASCCGYKVLFCRAFPRRSLRCGHSPRTAPRSRELKRTARARRERGASTCNCDQTRTLARNDRCSHTAFRTVCTQPPLAERASPRRKPPHLPAKASAPHRRALRACPGIQRRHEFRTNACTRGACNRQRRSAVRLHERRRDHRKPSCRLGRPIGLARNAPRPEPSPLNSLGLLLMALGRTPPTVFAGAFFFGMGYFGASAALIAAAGASASRSASTFLARQQSALDMGMVAGGLLAGAMMQTGCSL